MGQELRTQIDGSTGSLLRLEGDDMILESEKIEASR